MLKIKNIKIPRYKPKPATYKLNVTICKIVLANLKLNILFCSFMKIYLLFN